MSGLDKQRVSGLYGMADTSAGGVRTHEELGRILLREGVTIVQIRWKDGTDEQIAEVVEALLLEAEARGSTLVVNDRLEVAAAFPGVGLHLGQDDGDPRAARRRLGEGRVIGLSTHDARDVRAACDAPVDYLGFGPIFSGAGKHRSTGDRRLVRSPVGLPALAEAVSLAGPRPIVAIGGITASHLVSVRSTGVAAWAVLGAIAAAPDPVAAIRALR